jgi:predicted Zn-dependent protease
MKKLLGIVVLGLMLSNQALAKSTEEIVVVSYPSGAECTLKNNKNDIKITTKDTVTINFSKKKLKVLCSYPNFKTQIQKIKLRRKDSLSNFNGDLSNVKGLREIDEIIDGVCTVKSISNNPVSDVVCYGIGVAEIAVSAAVIAVKNLAPSLSKKTPETHTYSNSIIKGVNHIIIDLVAK